MAVVILDSSVTLSLAFEDEFDDFSVRAFEAARQGGALVPHLWPLEVANILSNGVKRGRLTEEDAIYFLALLAKQPIQIVHNDKKAVPIAVDLFTLSRRYGLTAYDAAYLQLALVSGLPLASKDQGLNAAAKVANIQLFEKLGI